MTEKRTNFWNDAGFAGLILGGISILYFVINLLLGKASANGVGTVAFNLLSMILWAGKTFLCGYLLYKALKKFALKEKAHKSRVFRFGMATAILSALLYSAANLLYLTMNPEVIEQSMSLVAEAYSSMLTADQIDQIMDMSSSMPSYSFFANLIYCWLYGTVLSAIFAGIICKNDDNPFANQE